MDLSEARKRVDGLKQKGDQIESKIDGSNSDESVDDIEDNLDGDVTNLDEQETTNKDQEEDKTIKKLDDEEQDVDPENGDEIAPPDDGTTDETGGEDEGVDQLTPEDELDLVPEGGLEVNNEQTTGGDTSEVDGEAPKDPESDPKFMGVIDQTQGMTEDQKSHQSSDDAAKDSQNASLDPGQQERLAESSKSEESAGKEPGFFDREKFVSALLAILEENAPKTQQDVDKGKGAGAKATNALKGEIETEKKNTGGDFQESVESDPDPTKETPKDVTDLTPTTEIIGETPNVEETIDPSGAAPKNKAPEEIEGQSQEISDKIGMLIPPTLQTKMMVGAPDDKYEQEADDMASKVMGMSDSSVASVQTSSETIAGENIQNAQLDSEENIEESGSTQEQIVVDSSAIQKSPENLLQRDGEYDSDDFTADITQKDNDPGESPIITEERADIYSKEAGVENANDLASDTQKQITEDVTQEYRDDEASEIDQTQQQQLAGVLIAVQDKQQLRTDEIEGVRTTQTETKTQDEVKRQEVNDHIKNIFHTTKADVNGILTQMDILVDQEFKRTDSRASRIFEQTQRREFKKWKNDHYKNKHGIKLPCGVKKWGIKYCRVFNFIKWGVDKLFVGLPDSVNAIYDTAKIAYLDEQKKGVTRIADIVEQHMMMAKARIDAGRAQVAEYVEKLPEDLKEVGAQAAAEAETQFQSLEQGVQDRQNQMVEELTARYEESIKKIDERIEALKAANKGLINKLLDVLAAIAKWILKFIAKLLKPVLSKIPFVGPVVNPLLDAIIDDPGGVIGAFIGGVGDGIKNFLKNITKHLKNGLFEWLFGVGLPITLPKKFDGEGILSILLQLFGLNFDFILGLAGDFFPMPIVNLMRILIEDGASAFKDIEGTLTEMGVPSLGVDFFLVLKDIITDGAVGFLGFLKMGKDGLAALQENFMSIIMIDVAIPFIIQKGVEYLLKMTNPAGGVVAIVEGLVKLVIFFIQNRDQIKELLNTLGEAIVAMVEKSRPLIASIIEFGLAQMIPILLGFLAALVGLDAIPRLISKALKAMLAPVTKFFTFIFEKISALFSKLKEKLGFGDNGEDDAEKRAELAADEVEREAHQKRDPDEVKGSLAAIEKKHKFTGREDKKDKKFDFDPPGKMFWNNERYYVKGETTQIEPQEDEGSTSKTGSTSGGTSTRARRKAFNGHTHTPDVQPHIQREIDSSVGRGGALTPDLQLSMGQAFKHDFSGVKIHNDTQGDKLARSMDAQAFTVGKDIYFRQGSYKPDTIQGKHLLAHELTHVVQQSNEPGGKKIQRKS